MAHEPRGAVTTTFSAQDQRDLEAAHAALEHPGFAIQVANVLGAPIEFVLGKLPARARKPIDTAARKAIEGAFKAAVATMDAKRRGAPARRWMHRTAVIAAGAAGGFFGWAGLAVELPITTATILRSIADIAREQGESLDDLETRLACLEVMALGGRTARDDASEPGYFAIRAALAQEMSAVARHVAQHGLAGGGAPVLVRAVNAVASRFSVPVSQKIAAEAVPVVGALAGAAVNAAFMAHFQAMAQGHFTMRRLERTHGKTVVKRAYARLGAK
jgi:hypothetical protein